MNDVKMKPIIFNTEMVKAVLSGRKSCGRKSCTRRPVKFPNYKKYKSIGLVSYSVNEKNIGKFLFESLTDEDDIYIKPPYQKGDILYVRETFLDDYAIGGQDKNGKSINVIYRADSEDKGTYSKWKPSIHMPKEYARLFLKVTNVRVERVQDITETDAKKEGMVSIMQAWTLVNQFSRIWNDLYKNWDSNPWVWVIDFEVVNNKGQKI